MHAMSAGIERRHLHSGLGIVLVRRGFQILQALAAILTHTSTLKVLLRPHQRHTRMLRFLTRFFCGPTWSIVLGDWLADLRTLIIFTTQLFGRRSRCGLTGIRFWRIHLALSFFGLGPSRMLLGAGASRRISARADF